MHIEKAQIAKIIVYRKRGLGTDAEGRAILVGTRAQMRDGTQKLVGMAFFLQGKGFGIGQTEHGHVFRPHFPFLPLARRFHQFALNFYRGSGIDSPQLFPCRGTLVNDALKIGKARTVVQLQKGEVFCIPAGAYPPADPDIRTGCIGRKGLADYGALHVGLLLVDFRYMSAREARRKMRKNGVRTGRNAVFFLRQGGNMRKGEEDQSKIVLKLSLTAGGASVSAYGTTTTHRLKAGILGGARSGRKGSRSGAFGRRSFTRRKRAGRGYMPLRK